MEILVKAIGVVGGIVLVALIMALPIWLLWNWLMPELFGITKITFGQSVGISFLTNALFNSSEKW